MFFLRDIEHLLFDTNPTLLRCNDSFIHSSRRIHTTQKFVCHRPRDLNSAQIPALYGLVSRQSQDIQETHAWTKLRLNLKIIALIVVFSSTCQGVLHVLSPILLHHIWMFLILFSSCCLSSSPDVTACRSAICSPLQGSIGTSPAPLLELLFFPSLALSQRLSVSLCAFILALPVKEGSLRSLSDSLSPFIVV